MKTSKRVTPNITTGGLSNLSKYFNQMEFKGILEDSNIYTVDQLSFRDAKNVYVDSDARLVSRPTLQKDSTILNSYIPWTYELVDVKDYSSCKLYISKSTLNEDQTYTIVMTPTESNEVFKLEGLSEYHISTIAHYIICFNNLGARIIDTNTLTKGWQDFNNFLEIPIIKRVVGSAISEYNNKNYFIPNKYKEQYIWNNTSHPQLPEGDAEVELVTARGNYTLAVSSFKNTIENINDSTDYRIIKPTNIKLKGTVTTIKELVSVAKNRICIAYENYFKYSLNGGESFSIIYYPVYSGIYLNIASISEDGTHFFFVTTYGVYRCDLGDFTWSDVFRCSDGAGGTIDIPYNNYQIYPTYKFKTKDIFSFIVGKPGDYKLFFKGPGLYMGTDYRQDFTSDEAGGFYKFGYIDKFNSDKSLYTLFGSSFSEYWYHKSLMLDMYLSTNYNGHSIANIVLIGQDGLYNNSRLLYIKGGDNALSADNLSMYNYTVNLTTILALGFIKKINDTYSSEKNFEVELQFIANYQLNNPYEIINIVINRVGDITNDSITEIDSIPYIQAQERDTVPLILEGGFILRNLVYSNISNKWVDIVYYLNDIEVRTDVPNYIVTSGDYFYIVDNSYNNAIYTNYLQGTDSATITYTITDKTESDKFTKIPKVSYSDTELYLAFDNLLQITQNTVDAEDPTKILFNLPKINNQSFIDNITGMVNISTTDVAIFFKNKITLCSKVEDENLGFRYDYYNTKLSTGIRLGDSAINTLEGSYTIFPTIRGLAAMNYQAFMATSDQTIEYITDNIKNLWSNFYKDSEASGGQIKIIQHRGKLIFTNNTRQILLYDLSSTTWWRWEIPVPVLIALSDQLSLRVINTTLLIFKQAAQYYDFSESGNFSTIDWLIQSQPLHMNAPNYYKNLKQLVFQFSESEKEISNKTMLAQIKLYRKKITVREPETVDFKIEGLRTFVKRFNYWKINEVQWGLADDANNSNPRRLELNGLSVKYEIGDEVR